MQAEGEGDDGAVSPHSILPLPPSARASPSPPTLSGKGEEIGRATQGQEPVG